MSTRQARPLPQGWSRRRLRFDARTNPVKSELDLTEDTEVSFVPMDAVGEFGGLRLDQTRELADVYNGYTYFADGDVCIAKITPCFENGKGAIAEGLANGVAFGTTELHVLRPSPRLDERFLFYLTIAHDFRSHGESEMLGAGGQKRVPEDFLKDWMPPLPRIEVQQRIARYLDEKTARIDALIGKKQALLERLAEKRQALITRAVTKGLNPNVPMKSSEIGWVGDIPRSWPIKPLKRMAMIGNGSTPSRDDSGYWDDGYYPWMNSSVVNCKVADEASDLVSDLALKECHLPKIEPPAVLVGITGQGKTRGMATLLVVEATINQHVAYLKPEAGTGDAAFIRYLLSAAYEHLRMESDGGGSTKGAITCEQLGNLMVPVPPFLEQMSISGWVDARISGMDRQMQLVSRSLEVQQAYRSALITAAVTGQLPELNG